MQKIPKYEGKSRSLKHIKIYKLIQGTYKLICFHIFSLKQQKKIVTIDLGVTIKTQNISWVLEISGL